MDIKKFNTDPIQGKKVLVAPLDWGLGHITRCIPIINALLKRGNTVIVAANPAGKALLKVEFPAISIVDLPEYAIGLHTFLGSSRLGLIRQWPRINRTIRRENHWLKNFCRSQSIEVIISDNRYGLYHKNIHCIFITHQLFVSSGFGERVDRWLMRIHFRYIARFNECWVPDNADPEKSLAGRLSHPPVLPPVPVTYIGLLSRFAGAVLQPESNRAYNDGLLIILSGPEPQRTLMETSLINQFNQLPVSVLLVRGLPANTNDPLPGIGYAGKLKSGQRVVNHLSASALQKAIMLNRTIICRSGYSTLMDLVALRRTAVLVPTPGQPEQQYLAGYLSARGWMISQSQTGLDLSALLAGTGNIKHNFTDEVTDNFPGKDRAGIPDAEELFFSGEMTMLTPQQISENQKA